MKLNWRSRRNRIKSDELHQESRLYTLLCIGQGERKHNDLFFSCEWNKELLWVHLYVPKTIKPGDLFNLITPIPGPGPKEATCKLRPISENITGNICGNITNLTDERSEYPLKITALKVDTMKITLSNTSDEKKLSDIGKIKLLFLYWKLLNKDILSLAKLKEFEISIYTYR